MGRCRCWGTSYHLESIQQAQSTPVGTTPPRLREAAVIALVERSIGLFERLGGLVQHDELLLPRHRTQQRADRELGIFARHPV